MLGLFQFLGTVFVVSVFNLCLLSLGMWMKVREQLVGIGFLLPHVGPGS